VGEDPKVLFPAMLKLLQGPDVALHKQAAQVVFQVGPEAVAELTPLIKKKDAPAIRLVCLQTLAMVGQRAKGAIPELIEALDDPAPQTRWTAARALGNIGPDAKAALEPLAKLEKDADANVVQIARAAITQIKSEPNQKMFRVQGVLTTGDPHDRVRQQMHHVVHNYYMKGGRQYTINLNAVWDNYLRLEDALGQELAQDDDGGGFPNARIIFNAPRDGWYRIIVTSFAPGASGPYTLTVQ
jgi:HEAT repeat protein